MRGMEKVETLHFPVHLYALNLLGVRGFIFGDLAWEVHHTSHVKLNSG